MGCFFKPWQSLSEDVATPQGWDQDIFIPTLLTASEVGSSKVWAAWVGVTFILSQMDCEHTRCFSQGSRPSTHTGSGVDGAFTTSPHSSSAKFAIRKCCFYLD